MHNIRLRNATIDDLPLLNHWDEQPHNIQADPNDDWKWETELWRKPAWRQQLIAELDERPIGFLQIIDPAREETHYWGDVPENLMAIDIWIGEKEDLGQGYGAIMMQLALESCFADPAVTAVIIDPLESNVKARKFYERIGFEFIENRQLGDDYCAIYHLTRDVWTSNQAIGIV